MRRRKRKIIALVLIVLLILAGIALWNRGKVPQWIVSQMKPLIIDTIVKYLPVEVVKINFVTRWMNLFRGQVPELQLDLKYQEYVLSLKGDLHIERNRENDLIRIKYMPTVIVDMEGQSSPSDPLNLELTTELDFMSQSIKRLIAKAKASRWQWKQVGLQSRSFDAFVETDLQHYQSKIEVENISLSERIVISHLALNSKGTFQNLETHIELGALEWSDEEVENAIRIEKIVTSVAARLPSIEMNLQAISGEFVFGDAYIEAPLDQFSIVLGTTLEGDSIKSLNVDLFLYQNKRGLHLKPTFVPALKLSQPQLDKTLYKIPWKLDYVPASSVYRSVKPVLSALPMMGGLNISAGGISGYGAVGVRVDREYRLKFETWESFLNFKDISLHHKDLQLKVEKFNSTIPISKVKTTQANFQIEKIWFRRLGGELKPMPVIIQPKQNSLSLDLPKGIPVSFPALPIKTAAIKGSIDTQDFQSKNFKAKTSLELRPTSILPIAQSLCLPTKYIPPSFIQATFRSVDWDGRSIRIEGQAAVKIFDGQLSIDKIRIYNLFSAVPETQFTSEWSGIRLDQLGKWLNFGEMDGVFVGYFRNVTFQKFLPTQYNLRAELKPLNHSKVILSPKAMKNFVLLFTGEDFEKKLPGIAQWMAFGWPSVMLGGYNIYFAGISIFSSDGSILLETLDPEDIIQSEKKHFILYGPRFKMPLRSKNYPLVLDAPAMASFVQHIKRRLASLKKNESEEKPNEKSSSCQPL